MLKKIKKILRPNHPLRLLYHKLWGITAALLYRFPASKMIIVGVTGTDGKTTTTTMIYEILRAAGIKVGLATSVEFAIGDERTKNLTHKTTLGRFGLQKLLRKMVDAGCTHAVIETSSHALSQSRVWGIPYDIALLTNISAEHMDYHVTMEQYKKDKGKLFASLQKSKKKGIPKTKVLNEDDEISYADFKHYNSEKTIRYGLQKNADVYASQIELSESGCDFSLHIPNKEIKLHLATPGKFNIYNAMAAAGVAHSLGVEIQFIKKGLENMKNVPGRMERIDLGQNFNVIIDYAMTPEAYRKVLTSVREITKGKLWIVFGCCGDRDRQKRPVLGKIVGELCDKIIITDDEPYTEDPEKIVQEIEHGLVELAKKREKDYFVIHDRKQALACAINSAHENDTIFVPGMGDLEGRTVGTEVIEWSDREVIKSILRERM